MRFGLFTAPVSNAIGETNYTRVVKPNLDEDKRVIIGPRNFYTRPMKKGKLDSTLFEKTSFTGIDCPYKKEIKINAGTYQTYMRD